MAKVKHFLAGLGGLLITLYFLGGAFLDMLQNLFNVDIPMQYYGLLSLGFIIGFIAIHIKTRRRRS